MARRPTPKAAAVYVRISSDRTGEHAGVKRQEADCLGEARRREWAVAEVYVDDDRSAFTRKPRPAYVRMLADIDAGQRDGVMVWRLDRLHRQPRELEEFIVICDRRRVALATVTGDVDLSSSQGRLLARAWGAFAVHESEVKSERIQRAMLERARKGLPHGGGGTRPYGYMADQLTVVPAEAAVIIEAADRVLAGDSLRAICRDLGRRRITTVCGHDWQPLVLRQVLASHRIAGVSSYRGESMGKARWKPIIAPTTSARLRALLMNPDRQTNVGAPTHRRCELLRGLVRCGLCGEVLSNRRRGRRRTYECVNEPGRHEGCGRMSITAGEIEDLLIGEMCERLDSVGLRSWLDRIHLTDAEWMAETEKAETAETKLSSLAEEFADGRLLESEWRTLRQRLVNQIASARTALTQGRGEMAVDAFVGRADSMRSAWNDMSRERRHAIAVALIHHVDILPRVKGQRRFQPSRVLVRWHGEPMRNRSARRSKSSASAGPWAGARVTPARAACPRSSESSGQHVSDARGTQPVVAAAAQSG